MRSPLVLASLLVVVGCGSHAEDRRWAKLLPPPTTPEASKPQLSVYSFPTPPDQKQTLSVKDLTGEGQAAYIALLRDSKDQAAFRRSVAAPIAPAKGLGATADPSFDRTLVIGVQKDQAAGVADRLMRTVVRIAPHNGEFTFSGYTVVATDNQVQSIAHLDTKTESSIDAKFAPSAGGLAGGSLEGKVDHTRETSADISRQYEKLNVDIQPGLVVITRESERGLDVVGNTIVKISLKPTPNRDVGSGINVFLVGDQTLFKDEVVLQPTDAKLEFETFASPLKCALSADVSMDYRTRRVVNGMEYYTEGKQDVQLIDGTVPVTAVELVGADETAPSLWQILVGPASTVLVAGRADGTRRLLTFNNYEAAQAFSSWLRRTGAETIGKDGVTLGAGGRPLRNAESTLLPTARHVRRSTSAPRSTNRSDAVSKRARTALPSVGFQPKGVNRVASTCHSSPLHRIRDVFWESLLLEIGEGPAGDVGRELPS